MLHSCPGGVRKSALRKTLANLQEGLKHKGPLTYKYLLSQSAQKLYCAPCYCPAPPVVVLADELWVGIEQVTSPASGEIVYVPPSGQVGSVLKYPAETRTPKSAGAVLCSNLYCSMTLSIFFKFAIQAFLRAVLPAFAIFGTAIAISIPIIATTIMISMRVKPLLAFCVLILIIPLLYYSTLIPKSAFTFPSKSRKNRALPAGFFQLNFHQAALDKPKTGTDETLSDSTPSNKNCFCLYSDTSLHGLGKKRKKG